MAKSNSISISTGLHGFISYQNLHAVLNELSLTPPSAGVAERGVLFPAHDLPLLRKWSMVSTTRHRAARAANVTATEAAATVTSETPATASQSFNRLWSE